MKVIKGGKIKPKLRRDKTKLMREYKSGMTFDTEAIRKYKMTIVYDGNELGQNFWLEVVTPRDKNGCWGKGEMTYYWDVKGKQFKFIEELLKERFEVLD